MQDGKRYQTAGSINKLNIQGGDVSIADRGSLKVNEIHVESLQDTATSSNSSKGGSVGAGFGSRGLSNVTASYNQAKGKNDKAWVNETSKLLIGNAQNDADLDAMGVKNVSNIGGVIANATKNADGSLTDHGKLNYSGALELKDIKDHNYNSSSGFNVSTSIGIPQKGTKEAANHPKGSTTLGVNSSGQETEQLTKATMGQGTVKNATDTTNRDIINTQEITRDQTTGMLDGSVTVDHRLLTESGRAEIAKEQKEIGKNIHTSVNNMRDGVEQLAKKLPAEISQSFLDSLNQIELKLNKLPEQNYAGGELIANTYETLILAGVDRQNLIETLGNEDSGLISLASQLAKIEQLTAELIEKGYTQENILIYQGTGSSNSNIVNIDGKNELQLGGAPTLGIQLFQTINDFNKDISYLINESGVDPQTVQLVIGAIVSGPLKLAGNVVASLATDTLFGEYIESAKDSWSNKLTAQVHLISEGNTLAYLDAKDQQHLINSLDEIDQNAVNYGNWLADTKDGAKVLLDVVFEQVAGIASGGVVSKKTTKIDDNNVEVSVAGVDVRGGAAKEKGGFITDNPQSSSSENSTIYADAGSKGNWDPVLNKTIQPNTSYKLSNGHTYMTDNIGRVSQVEGKLNLTTMDRNTYQQNCAGKCVNAKGDEGGHLIASSLGGAGDKINLVPQARTLNRGDWKAMELQLANELKAGKSVNIKIDVGYSNSSSVRPNEFNVTAVIDGVKKTWEFDQ